MKLDVNVSSTLIIGLGGGRGSEGRGCGGGGDLEQGRLVAFKRSPI